MKLLASVSLAAALLLSSALPAATLCASGETTKITTPATGYTSAEQVAYQKSGKYVKNWGARGEDCTFLTTYAQEFYTGADEYATLSKKTGGSSQANAPQSELYAALKQVMTVKHTYQTSYDATRDLYKYTDCLKNDSTKISSFYSGTTFNSTWDKGQTWNREHTWPNSKGLNGKDENDIMMLRPTLKSENGSRGNKSYGESSGYHHLNDGVKGDCARIVLYVYVRWGNVNKMWGTEGVIESMDVLLRWMEADPVDTWEMGRNDAVQSITGTRNIFVDYPEYAWQLFGKEIPQTAVTPSGIAQTGSAPTDSSSSTEDSSSTEESSSTDSSSTEESNSSTESSSKEKEKGCGSALSFSVGSVAVALLGAYVIKRKSR